MSRHVSLLLPILVLVAVTHTGANIFNSNDALVRATRFGKLVEHFRGRLSEFLWNAFGSGGESARPTPVGLGVQVSDGVLRTLLPNNTAVPVKMSHLFSGKCRDTEDKLELGVFANPNLHDYKLGEIRVSCDPGGPGEVRIEQTLSIDKQGKLIFSLEDMTGRYPAHTLQKYLPEYERLVGLFAPFQDLLQQAHDSFGQLQVEFDAGQTVASDLNIKLMDVEKEMESTSRELWDCLRQANNSEQQIKLTTEKLSKEKKAREATTLAMKKAKADSEKVVVTAKGELQRKEAEVAELGGRVKTLKKELKALGKEAEKERRYLEDQRKSTEDILRVKTVELEDQRTYARWWSGVAGLVTCVFALVVVYGVVVLWKRSREDMDESSVEGSAKRERRRLLRLLARVRQVKEPSTEPSPSKGAQEDDTDTVDPNLVRKYSKDEDDGAADVFPSTVVMEKCGAQDARRIRIQCPGVAEADVTIKIIFNGVEVHIDRKRTPGLEALTWMRSFVFPVEEGNFTFKDAATRLDRGVLELVCIAKEVQPRFFRFPEHFDMAYDDFDTQASG